MSSTASGDSKSIPGSKVSNTSVDNNSTRVDFTQESTACGRNIVAMNNEVKFHKILKKLMDGKKMSSRALAKELKMPHSTLASYLSGKKASYSAEHIGLIAAHFKVSSDFLLFGKQDPLSSLNEIPVEELFEGWLKVKILRAVSSTKKSDDE